MASGNAIKFTGPASAALSVAYEEGAVVMRFAVADTGVGMAEEQLPTIRKFEAFGQGGVFDGAAVRGRGARAAHLPGVRHDAGR